MGKDIGFKALQRQIDCNDYNYDCKHENILSDIFSPNQKQVSIRVWMKIMLVLQKGLKEKHKQ